MRASDGPGVQGWGRRDCVGVAPREQGHAICVTLGPCLLLRSGGEAGMGRKKTLLLGWLTHGVQLAAGAAQARRDVVKRYWLVGGTQRSVSARVGGEAKLGRLGGPRACRRAGRTGWATRPSKPGLLLLPRLPFLLFPFLFLFLFVLCYTSFMYINQSGIFLLWYNVPW